MDKIFNTFYSKLPETTYDIMPLYDKCKLVTCLTPYYMTIIPPDHYSIYDEFDFITSDGSYPLIINKLVGKPKSIRLSFDMSSMAPIVFNNAITNNAGIFFLGAKPDEIGKSVTTIKSFFPELNICGYHHGYIKNCKEEVLNFIIDSGAKICIIGMGAPLQDEMAVLLKRAGFIGTVYTCGGFFHQTTNQIESFPEWTNKLNVRFIYRWFHEKGLFARTPRQIYGCIRYGWWLKFKG